MRTVLLAGVVGFAITGCSGSAQSDSDARAAHGRYLGVGAYPAGQLWSKMTLTGPAKPASAATIGDDEHVIVVVDSQTGEVRECGDYSGVCVGLRPWSRAVAAQQTSPVTLTKHMVDLQQEQSNTARRARPP